MLSPSSPTPLPTATLPPTPPNASLLDDIYASSPSSSSPPSPSTAHAHPNHPDDLLSDLPLRRRTLDTDAYREGLSAAKGTHVQDGFDEGYTLGAELGVRVGQILGVLQGVDAALEDASSRSKNREEERKEVEEVKKEVRAMLESAREELKIERVMGGEWVDGEGVFRWGVGEEGIEGGKEEEEEVTFREVAGWHPVVRGWEGKVREGVGRWGVDLGAVERGRVEVVEGEMEG